jgi:hypothetical protein
MTPACETSSSETNEVKNGDVSHVGLQVVNILCLCQEENYIITYMGYVANN